jgi:hypothetical protein
MVSRHSETCASADSRWIRRHHIALPHAQAELLHGHAAAENADNSQVARRLVIASERLPALGN